MSSAALFTFAKRKLDSFRINTFNIPFSAKIIISPGFSAFIFPERKRFWFTRRRQTMQGNRIGAALPGRGCRGGGRGRRRRHVARQAGRYWRTVPESGSSTKDVLCVYPFHGRMVVPVRGAGREDANFPRGLARIIPRPRVRVLQPVRGRKRATFDLARPAVHPAA